MKIVTTQFDGPVSTDYKKLLTVFKKSVEQYMPGVDFIELLLDAPEKRADKKYGFISNSAKLESWVEFLRTCEDDVIFTDCDMLMLKSAQGAFDSEFDIAYTKRYRSSHIPINGGVVMVRPNERSIDFFEKYRSNRGSIYGTTSNSRFSAFLRPRNKEKSLHNLYLVGGSTHPGGGIPLVIQSAFNAVDLLLRNE